MLLQTREIVAKGLDTQRKKDYNMIRENDTSYETRFNRAERMG